MYFLRRIIGDPDVAIDLGTANTRVFVNGKGLLADEPTVVRLKKKTPNAEVDVDLFPLRGGAVVDADVTVSLLQPLLHRAKTFGLLRPRAIVTVPTDASEWERYLLCQSVHRSGVSSLHLAPEPLAAAIGAGLDITSRHAQMLLDIGDGVTDIAIIRASELVATGAVRKACSDLHDAARKFLRKHYHLAVSRKATEQLTHDFGAAFPSAASLVSVCGTHLTTNESVSLSVREESLVEAFRPVLDVILATIKTFVKDLPDSIAADVYEAGIHLSGGGAYIKGLADRIALETSLPINVVNDPLHAVINGSRQMLITGIQTNLWQ